MSEYLKSAFGYLNGSPGGGNDFVGQTLEINGVKLRVNRLIAEGESDQLEICYCYFVIVAVALSLLYIYLLFLKQYLLTSFLNLFYSVIILVILALFTF